MMKLRFYYIIEYSFFRALDEYLTLPNIQGSQILQNEDFCISSKPGFC